MTDRRARFYLACAAAMFAAWCGMAWSNLHGVL